MQLISANGATPLTTRIYEKSFHIKNKDIINLKLLKDFFLKVFVRCECPNNVLKTS